MKSIWQGDARRELCQRLGRLTPASRPLWGRMSALQMVAHLADSTRMVLGDVPVCSKHLPLRFTPIKQLFIYWLPFPRNVSTSPERVARTPLDWAAECASAEGLLNTLATTTNANRPEHPVFGRMSDRAWGVFVYRHFDHHLRQFGV